MQNLKNDIPKIYAEKRRENIKRIILERLVCIIVIVAIIMLSRTPAYGIWSSWQSCPAASRLDVIASVGEEMLVIGFERQTGPLRSFHPTFSCYERPRETGGPAIPRGEMQVVGLAPGLLISSLPIFYTIILLILFVLKETLENMYFLL